MSPLTAARATNQRNAFTLASKTTTFLLIALIISLALATSSCGLAQGASTSQSAKSAAASGKALDAKHLTVSGSLPTATMGAAYTGSIQASGGVAPYKFAVVYGTLPAGLS